MNSIMIMIKRELMIFAHHWYRYVIFWILFPVIIFLCVSMPLYEIISISILNYLHWSVAGILIITSSIICSNYGLRQIFLFKGRNTYYQVFIKSPMTLGEILTGIYLISILYGIIQFLIGSVVLGIINPGALSFIQCLLLLIQIIPFLMIISSISLLCGFFISNEEIVTFLLISFFLIIAFALGALLPINLFPDELSLYLINIPLVNIIMNTQKILHLESPHYFGLFIGIIASMILYIIAIIVAYKTIRKQA